jgi:4'-phosphopantetheinyl transferase EntD
MNLQALRPLMGDVGFGTATVADYEQLPLHPDEARSTDGMLPKRRRDFWMGRSAARRALADLGGADGPVVVNQRRPIFPAGLTGSLSHSAGVAVAIVAPTARFRSLGIDLELHPLPARAAALVLSPEDLHWVTEGRCSCTDAFSAKEAAYKALDPLLDGGAPPLRQILLDLVEGGFKVRLAKWPQLQAFVSIRHLTTGTLAWTAIL